MKNILFAILLFTSIGFSQERPDWDYDLRQPISTDFPDKLPYYRDYLPLQNTYYELNITLNNIRQLVRDNLKMNFKENAPSGANFQFEIYTSPSKREPLQVKYNTFTCYGLDVVKSVEITGGFANVAKLFIDLYNTNLSTSDMPVNQAKKYFKQDYAVFTVLTNGKASITISNTKYLSNSNDFVNDFNIAKEALKD